MDPLEGEWVRLLCSFQRVKDADGDHFVVSGLQGIIREVVRRLADDRQKVPYDTLHNFLYEPWDDGVLSDRCIVHGLLLSTSPLGYHIVQHFNISGKKSPGFRQGTSCHLC